MVLTLPFVIDGDQIYPKYVFLSMGSLKIYGVKGKKPQQGEGVQRPPPSTCILGLMKNETN